VSLKKLTIEHLRGSVAPFALDFEKGKKLTVLYGENGTGKTTVCDALEFLGKGRVGSLENRGLGKTSKYWPSVGKKPGDVSVSLEFGGATCAGKIQKGDVVVDPADARPKVEVLRRSQILSLLEAKPADRYAEIKRFIDVSGVEASEGALRDLIRGEKTGRETAIARVSENENAIRSFWEQAGKPAPDALTWAAKESSRDTTGLQTELLAIGALRSAYQRLVDLPEKFRLADESRKASEDIAIAARQKYQELLGKAAEGSDDLVGILESAKAYLEKHPNPEHCPLCESAEMAKVLPTNVPIRLEQFSALRGARAEKVAADTKLQQAEKRLQDLKGEAVGAGAEFEKAKAVRKWEADVPVSDRVCPVEPAGLKDWLDLTKMDPDAWRKAESFRLDNKRFIATLKAALETYKTNLQSQKDLDLLIPKLERALEVVEDERRKFTDSILSKIADEVGRLYEVVHPGEGLNKISLALDPEKRASLDIGADFHGAMGSPPQAYFSQSHLDTLGLCVFLALATLEDPDKTILILDDILASVDEPHVERLIEMLYTEAMRFRHCIITTHYRPWKQKLRWGWLQNGQCHFVELTKWTKVGGLALVRSVPDVQRLRLLLAETPPDPQLVCAKAGVILEAALDFLTLLYEVAVPRRAGGLYTLGDLLPSINKKLRDALKVEVLIDKDSAGAPIHKTLSLTPILEELVRIAQARNAFGCHFNAISFELLDSDAIGFGQQVLALMDILTDVEKGWPKDSRSGSYWATSGETRRLHPLKQPK
jgi:hypothetical protein